jgi:hypothetical protein
MIDCGGDLLPDVPQFALASRAPPLLSGEIDCEAPSFEQSRDPVICIHSRREN